MPRAAGSPAHLEAAVCAMTCERFYEHALDAYVAAFGHLGPDAWGVGWAAWSRLAGAAADALHALGA